MNKLQHAPNCGKGEETAGDLKACTALHVGKILDCKITHRPRHKKEWKRRAVKTRINTLWGYYNQWTYGLAQSHSKGCLSLEAQNPSQYCCRLYAWWWGWNGYGESLWAGSDWGLFCSEEQPRLFRCAMLVIRVGHVWLGLAVQETFDGLIV